MTRLHRLALAACCVLAAACADPAPPPLASGPPPTVTAAPPARAAQPVRYIFYDDEFMRHAYRDPVPLKADVYDDARWEHPERYAITVPPDRSIRPLAEWEPMRALVLGYPAGMAGYANATATVSAIARHAAEVADVWIVVDAEPAIGTLTAGIQAAGLDLETLAQRVRFVTLPIDSIWFIDYGPFPVLDSAGDTFAFADFRYYHQRPRDDGLPTALGRGLEALGAETPATTYRMPLSTEGGNLQATLDGICFTSDRQLFYMSCGRGACDSGLTSLPLDELQEHELTLELEGVWGPYLGCQDVVITRSISDDGTGHIDMYFKVVDDHTIVLGEYRAPFAEGTGQEANAARMDENDVFLEAYQRPTGGGGFEVHRLVMPGHQATSQGGVPFTYLNSTLINGVNLWPAYLYEEWEASRDEAEATWEAVMPEWDHIWIDSSELSFWSGAIHCITRTVPEAAAAPWVADGTCDGVCVPRTEGAYDGDCHPNGIPEEVCWGPAWVCGCNDCGGGCAHFPSGDECGGIGDEGCCEGTELLYCEGGALQGGACGDDGCGWDPAGGWYDCGFGGGEPSGDHPRSCEAASAAGCSPECQGRSCGADGCGGTCGECLPGQGCSEAGQCTGSCADQCSEGEHRCLGSVARVCLSSSGCADLVEADCAAVGLFCHQGACVTAAELPPDDGCQAAPRPPLWWLALLALGLGGAARRRRECPGGLRALDPRWGPPWRQRRRPANLEAGPGADRAPARSGPSGQGQGHRGGAPERTGAGCHVVAQG